MNNVKYDVLIVDDEIVLGQATAEYFNVFNVAAFFVSGGAEALEFLKENKVSLILLDINLSDESGFALCKKIRESIDIPILFVSARNSDDDILMALNIGGDDYITKPYSLSVLLAKVKARLKRIENNKTENDTVFHSGNITIDYEKLKVFVNGKDVCLKTMEFKLLSFLAQNANKVISKEELFSKVWGVEFYSDGTLSVHIRRLREKIEQNPNEPQFIKTVWGVGYVFENK